jgi:hypothetical protein
MLKRTLEAWQIVDAIGTLPGASPAQATLSE